MMNFKIFPELYLTAAVMCSFQLEPSMKAAHTYAIRNMQEQTGGQVHWAFQIGYRRFLSIYAMIVSWPYIVNKRLKSDTQVTGER